MSFGITIVAIFQSPEKDLAYVRLSNHYVVRMTPECLTSLGWKVGDMVQSRGPWWGNREHLSRD